MKEQLVSFTLNSEVVTVKADPAGSLLAVLRDKFGLYGTKAGCEQGECGACTVLLNGRAVNSCLLPLGRVEGCWVETIESLAKGEVYHPIQEAFVEAGAVQCGFCSPGMIMTSLALLRHNPRPSPAEVSEALAGNLCRCSGYKQIEAAILLAAQRIKDGRWKDAGKPAEPECSGLGDHDRQPGPTGSPGHPQGLGKVRGKSM